MIALTLLSPSHLLDFAHHFGGLLELLEEAVYFDDRSAGTFGDAVLAAAVEQCGIGTLLGSHRADDGFDGFEGVVADLYALEGFVHTGDHAHEVFH